jgi:hypothetical protein
LKESILHTARLSPKSFGMGMPWSTILSETQDFEDMIKQYRTWAFVREVAMMEKPFLPQSATKYRSWWS